MCTCRMAASQEKEGVAQRQESMGIWVAWVGLVVGLVSVRDVLEKGESMGAIHSDDASRA